jgi:hypothetical protein
MLVELHNKNYNIDFKSQQLTFLDSRFYTTENGGFVPSVTTILEAYPKDAQYYAWIKKMGEDADTVRDEAGRRGSTVHGLTERYDAGEEIKLLDENGYIAYSLLEWDMLNRYAEFIERFSPEVISSELNIVSERLGFAGTLDRVVSMNGKRILIDIKTSNAIYPTYWLQLAAYEKLLTEATGYNPIDEVAILWLNAKTRTEGKKGDVQGKGWHLLSKDDTDKEWLLFQATKQLWTAQNEDCAPKQTTYKLSITKK